MTGNYVITIARGYGSGGTAIGKKLSEELNINYYDRQLIRMASDDSGIHERLFGEADERIKLSTLFRLGSSPYDGSLIPPESAGFVSDKNLFGYQAKIIKELAEKESCVIMGRCADFILKDRPNVVKVFVHASEEFRIQSIMERTDCSRRDAERDIKSIDRYRSEYYKHYTGNDWQNVCNYDLSLNSEELGFDKCAEIVKSYLNIRFR